MNARAFFSDKPIAYHPILAKLFGSVTAALFLSQLAYWNDKGSDPSGWIWKTAKEMMNETGLSPSEQETARRILREHKVLKEKRRGIPARMWYWIDWDQLEILLNKLPQSSSRKQANLSPKTYKQDAPKAANYPENTRESTTKSTSLPSESDESDFSAVFQTVEGAMGRKLNPQECNLLKGLWAEKPNLDAHHFAYLQTKRNAAAFNLAYYRKCLEGYVGSSRQNQIVEAGTWSKSG